MSKTITIDPITRISGFLEIKAEVEESTIVNVNVSGLLFRGFEKILKGRMPLDAIYFTERICGICSTAHSLASTLALEDAMNITVRQNDWYIRDIMHGFEIVQNHLRQFYQFTLPSYVKIKSIKLVGDQEYSDFRLPEEINKKLEEHYVASIEMSRLAHEGLAVLGGKAPHCHGIYVGGVTVNLDAYTLEKVKSIISNIKAFVTTIMREDMEIITQYYSDYFEKGISYPNFMSYGLFDSYEDTPENKEITYVKPGIMKDGVWSPFNARKITEQVRYAWFTNNQNIQEQEVDLSKPDAYTFIKAPRYEGVPMEVGPLARQIINGEYTRGHSCLDRNIARVLETEKVIQIMDKLSERVELLPNNQKIYQVPEKAFGVGLIDTSRGSLGHWIQIENQVINHYNLIPPTVWNLSPKDAKDLPGVIEKSLLNTTLQDINQPVEIGRIARSFDPCVSCATHLIGKQGELKVVEIPI